MQKKGDKKARKSDWERLKRMPDEKINLGDIPELTDADFANAEVGTLVSKIPLSIRLDQDVVEWFRAQGPGYQTRINEVLKKHIAEIEVSGSYGAIKQNIGSRFLGLVREAPATYMPNSLDQQRTRQSHVLNFALFLDHLASMFKDSGELKKAKSASLLAVSFCAKAALIQESDWEGVVREMTEVSDRLHKTSNL